MAVFAIISITIVGSTMSTLAATGSTRASVQAQAAAEAGIDVAAASLATSICPGDSATVGIQFKIKIEYQSADDGVWTPDCPTVGVVAKNFKVVATGLAEGVTWATAVGGDTRRVEAIFKYTPADEGSSAAGEVLGTGAAIYAYGSLKVFGSSQLQTATEKVEEVDGSRATIQLKTGDLSCVQTDVAGTGIITADVVVGSGDLVLGGSCQVMGNAWADGLADLHGSSKIHGSLVAEAVTAKGSAIIYKDVWATGDVDVKGSAQIYGGIEGVLSGLLGALWPAPSTPRPETPSVPDWVDYDYNVADWPEFEVITLPSTSTCDVVAIRAAIAGAKKKRLVDARACAKGIDLVYKTETLTLNGDLALIAKEFALGLDGHIDAASQTNLWMITPDLTDNSQPSCPKGVGKNTFTMNQSFIIHSHVNAMVYTPCGIQIGFSAQLNGQLYGDDIKLDVKSITTYGPVGLPGVDLDLGLDIGIGGTSKTPAYAERTSIRDLD
ncbi:hypothetical protein E3T55_01125 [Cryobacterium frigoriphilum]|uniref:Polymer-forming cytoskeletal protein n=1 Tax=Cryobacterium frigoriphilum TaxID=1259150 RepID=A0A4R9ABF5_9MICO|nr:hypothetical protein [Cryobacterium frigoriphilum]TFD55439.1 hypothetical protein E3T55_01125 [Cryobacterium frigoriphilum]